MDPRTDPYTLTRAGSVSGQVAAIGICSGGGARRAGELSIARPLPLPRAARRGLSFPVRQGRCTPGGLLEDCCWGDGEYVASARPLQSQPPPTSQQGKLRLGGRAAGLQCGRVRSHGPKWTATSTVLTCSSLVFPEPPGECRVGKALHAPIVITGVA